MSQEELISSFLLYVDTERSKNTNSTGTNVIIPLNESGITCNDGEFFRLSLVNFSSFRNYPSINRNNNVFNTRCTRNPAPTTAVVPVDVAIRPGNYSNCFGVANNFATNLAADILQNNLQNPVPVPNVDKLVVIASLPATSVLPDNTYMNNASEDGQTGIVDFTLEARNNANVAQPHTLTEVLIQMYIDNGDCWAIMGGDRIRDKADITTNSMIVSFPSTSQIRVQGRYPMQKYTNDYVYLRTNVQSSNMQTPSFNAGNTDAPPGSVEGSRILARIPCYNEFNYFVTFTQREYFLNLTQRSIPELTLNLTDSQGRELPFIAGANTLGNMSFSCVIRVEVIKNKDITMANLKPVQKPIPARKSSAPLIIPDAGVDSYVSPLIGVSNLNIHR